MSDDINDDSTLNQIGNDTEKEHVEIEELQTFGLRQLFATMIDLKTLPHILLLLVLSSLLYGFAQTSDTMATYSSIAFLSLAGGYVLTATGTRWESVYKLVRVSEINSESWFKSLVLRSLRAWSLPLILSGIIATGFFFLIKEYEFIGEWLPLSLASLFLIWSIGQGMSFRSGTATWIAGSQKSLDDNSRSGGIAAIAFWQLFAVSTVAILIGYWFSNGFTGEFSEKAGWIGFIIISIGIQIGIIYWLSELLQDVSSTKGGARFAILWSMISQIFVTWHFASAWRRFVGETSVSAMIIEELFLMAITVLLAIWALASRSISRGGKLFTSDNALFWGLAFGFGYSGSIAMITYVTSTFGDGNLAITMAIGHLVTAATIVWIHPMTLNRHASQISKLVKTPESENIEDIPDTIVEHTEDVSDDVATIEVDLPATEHDIEESVESPTNDSEDDDDIELVE